MPPKPPLCPAYSASQTLTLTTIPEDLYSPLKPQEQAIFDDWAWSTVFSPPMPTITNFSLPSSHQSSRLGNLAVQFKKIGSVKRPSPPPYLPILSKEGNGLGFIFGEATDNQKVHGERAVVANNNIDADHLPLHNWLQGRLEAVQTREDFEKEACAATEELKETDTGVETAPDEVKERAAVSQSIKQEARSHVSTETPKKIKRKGSNASSDFTACSSPRNNIFSPTGRILGISATLFAPTLGKRKSGNMAERNRLSFDAKRARRSSLSSLSITQLDKVTPLFASAALHASAGSCTSASELGVITTHHVEGLQKGQNIKATEPLSRKRSLRRTVSSFFVS